MGASEPEDSGGTGVDCTVGTIVWVRRRNGSWWPGRILGQHELSKSHLMSPRSGTPVKLLGREDASVDWYNLEKSKRVKAFRCGEFDACIERAEASQGIPIKKREKYARREDAILHALELERLILENQQKNLPGSSISKFSALSKNDSNIGFPFASYLRNDENVDHSKRANPKSHLFPRVFSEITGNPMYSQKGKSSKLSNWEDVTTETTPRMREIQDLGLHPAQSKRKDVEGINRVGSSKNIPIFKKKKLQDGLTEEILGKRRDRRRPLVKVLQGSAQLPASQSLPSSYVSVPLIMQEQDVQRWALPHSKRNTEDYMTDDSNGFLDHTGYSSDHMQMSSTFFEYHGPLGEEFSSSGLVEANESGCSDRDSSDSDTEDDEAFIRGANQPLASFSRNPGCAEDDRMSFPEVRYGTVGSHDEALQSDYLRPLYSSEHIIDTAADIAVSKWNMKGKRNIRNLIKRPMEAEDPKNEILHNPTNGASYESKRHPLRTSRKKSTGHGFYQKLDDFYENEFVENDLDSQLAHYDSHRYSLMLKNSSRDIGYNAMDGSDEDSLRMSPSSWETDRLHHTARRSHWDFDQYYPRHFSEGLESMLVDVDLKVQTSYQGERVPLVSLMSRLNGKAIIGHPVQIEILDDGSTNALLSRNESGEDPSSADGNVTPPSVWRTGRRTAMQRIPRPHPIPTALDGKEFDPLHSNLDLKASLGMPSSSQSGSKLMSMKKSYPNSFPSVPMKFQKKASKKVSLSNQKTRTLSSFASEPKHRSSRKADKLVHRESSVLDAFKPGDSAPIVACIPVKLVFSRILEAVGRSSSSLGHCVLTSGLAQRGPS